MKKYAGLLLLLGGIGLFTTGCVRSVTVEREVRHDRHGHYHRHGGPACYEVHEVHRHGPPYGKAHGYYKHGPGRPGHPGQGHPGHHH